MPRSPAWCAVGLGSGGDSPCEPHPDATSAMAARSINDRRICQGWHNQYDLSMASCPPAAPTPSVLGQALLGLLARRPATGYSLAQQMRHPVAFFWEARHSQIYPELARLEDAGLLAHRTIAGRGPHPTKEYRLTPTGRRAHEVWVLGDVDQAVRDVETVHVWSTSAIILRRTAASAPKGVS